MVLFPLIAAALILSPGIQQKDSLYRQAVKKPDLRNGYEDYLKAADRVGTWDFSFLSSWTPTRYEELSKQKSESGNAPEGEGTWSPAYERLLALAKEMDGKDLLTVRQAFVSRFGDALIPIEVGNTKQIWDPREKIDAATAFPELATFKSLAKLVSADAYVRFARGDSSGATKSLLEGYTFSVRIGGTTIIAELVSVASRAIILASFEEHLARLSEPDTERIISVSEALLAEPPSMVKAWQGERKFMLNSIDQDFAGIGDVIGGDDDDDEETKKINAFAKSMTESDKKRLIASLKRQISDMYDRLLKRYDAPESDWSEPFDLELPGVPEKVTSVEDMADLLIHLFVPVFDQANVTFVRSRAQLRLLGLHARIINFRWQHHRLPNDLAEAVPESLRFDPLSREAFHYEPQENSYRLYSKGIASTGQIELKYKRPPNLGEGEGIPPLLLWSRK